jgi:hypothetical protein
MKIEKSRDLRAVCLRMLLVKRQKKIRPKREKAKDQERERALVSMFQFQILAKHLLVTS